MREGAREAERGGGKQKRPSVGGSMAGMWWRSSEGLGDSGCMVECGEIDVGGQRGQE